jgi:cytosine/adenosine deaminase-related metal-dependent hydrolase
MPNRQLYYKYGLIGDELELKSDVFLEIDEKGLISNLEFSDPPTKIQIVEDKDSYLLIPGLINSHIHIGDSFAKEMGFNRRLHEIVSPPNGLKHQLLDKVSNVVKIEGIKNAAIEMISNGITYFIDFRERGLEGINLLNNALKDFGIRYLTFGRFNHLNEIETIFHDADGIGLASYQQISTDIKKIIKENKRRYKKKINCHCAESKRDEELITEIFCDEIVDVIIHGTHFQKQDLEIMKKRNISLVLCPRSNGYFGVGFPPIPEILKLQIPISLGTDNIMANSPDLFEEMRYLYRIYRVLAKNDDEILLSAKELLKMATINAANIYGINKNVGSISEGKDADFFFVNLNDPNYYSIDINIDRVYPLIVQRTRSENIKKVYIKGEIMFER